MRFGPKVWSGAWLLVGWLCCAAAQAQQPAQFAPFTGFNGSLVRFASVDEGRKVLAADDEWTAATSDFQRAATPRW